MKASPDRKFVLIGWWLFVASAVFFMLAAWRAGDLIAFIGAAAFMCANVSFLIPFYRNSSQHDFERED
jgi:F0F1-type ATP synthase assembly protein I